MSEDIWEKTSIRNERKNKETGEVQCYIRFNFTLYSMGMCPYPDGCAWVNKEKFSEAYSEATQRNRKELMQRVYGKEVEDAKTTVEIDKYFDTSILKKLCTVNRKYGHDVKFTDAKGNVLSDEETKQVIEKCCADSEVDYHLKFAEEAYKRLKCNEAIQGKNKQSGG